MAHPVAKALTGFFIVAVLSVVAAVVLTLSQSSPALAPLPQPNGYHDFVKAGEMVTDDSSYYGTMNQQELRAFVKKNAEALKLARAGLGHKCRAPLDFSATSTTNLHNRAVIKRLAFGLTAEARLAEMENRLADAVEAYLAVIRLGCAMSQGGLPIDSLTGIGVAAIVTAPLEKLAQTVDAKQCREAASALESCEAQREPIETIWARERAWARRAYGVKGRIMRLVMFRTLKQSEKRVNAKLKTHQTRIQALLIQLAARAYELEKGERPKSLADLVPAYLKANPHDPLTGTNMAYHP